MIAALDGGASYHAAALRDPLVAQHVRRVIYAPDLPGAALDGVGTLIVTDRVNPRLLAAGWPAMRGLLARGGTLAVMGETWPHLWLPGVRWTSRPTNFWWWRQPGASSGVVVLRPEHGLFRFLTPADCEWHYHGVFAPPPEAEVVLEVADGGGALLYENRRFGGRLVVASLDPFYHHGSGFMPAATRFLHGFLPWLATHHPEEGTP